MHHCIADWTFFGLLGIKPKVLIFVIEQYFPMKNPFSFIPLSSYFPTLVFFYFLSFSQTPISNKICRPKGIVLQTVSTNVICCVISYLKKKPFPFSVKSYLKFNSKHCGLAAIAIIIFHYIITYSTTQHWKVFLVAYLISRYNLGKVVNHLTRFILCSKHQ